MKRNVDMSKEAVTFRLNQMEGLWLLSKSLRSAKVISKSEGPNRTFAMRSEIREILERDWNPLNLANPVVGRPYDKYIGPVLHLLVGSRDADELMSLLRTLSRVEFNRDERSDEEMLLLAAKLLDVNVMLN